MLLILKSSGVKKVKLTGGEPSLRTDLFEIIDFCIELGLSASVYSNLYVSSNVVDRLLNYPISISTSIHGTEFYHDSVTKIGVYKIVYQNIRRFTKAHIPVSVHMVVMNRNYIYAEDVINESVKAGVEKIVFQTLIPREKRKSTLYECQRWRRGKRWKGSRKNSFIMYTKRKIFIADRG